MKKSIAGITGKKRVIPEFQPPVIVTYDTKTGTGSTVHSMTNVPAGAALIVTTQDEFAQNNGTVSSTPSLTWTRRASTLASQSGDAAIWTTTFPAGGNITVTSDWPGGAQSSVCYVITGADTTFSGASGSVASQSLPSISLTTTRAASLLLCVTSDWDANSGTPVYRDGAVQTGYTHVPVGTTGYHYYKQASSITTYTEGLTAPNMTGSAGTCILEVRPATPTGPDTTPPTAPVLSSGIITSSSIGLTWTDSTDAVGVIGYDVYQNGVYINTTVSTNYTLTGLTESTQYSVYVVAKDAAGNSTPSNTITPSTIASGGGFGTLMYHNGFNSASDLVPSQLGAGVISTTVKIEGAGSFKSIVPAGSGPISSGYRSEQQYGENLSPNNQPIVVQYYTRFEILPNVGGLSCQWHGNTQGTSGQCSLWIDGGDFMVMRSTCGGSGCGNIYQTQAAGGGPLMSITLNQWYLMRWEITFTSSNNGYVRLYIDDILYFNSGTTKTADGSGQYLKVGQNLFASPAVNSTLYVDDLNVWFA